MSVSLKLTVTLQEPSVDPGALLVEYDGEIYALDDNYEQHLVGSARVFVARLEACEDHGFSMSDCLDSQQATAPYMALLHSEYAGSFAPAVQKILDEPDTFCMDTLIIDRIEVLPAFRGRGYGLDAMKIIIAQLGGGCRIAAIKPYPLQFEPKESWQETLELHRFSDKKSKATKRLKDLYAGIGFKSVGRTDLMIRGL